MSAIHKGNQGNSNTDITTKIFQIGTPPSQSESTLDLEKITTWSKEAFGWIKETVQYDSYKGPRNRLLTYGNNELVNYLFVIETNIEIDGISKKTGGIGGVVTSPNQRNRGFCTYAMNQAKRFIFEGIKADLGFLFSLPETVDFYKKSGWKKVDCKVLVKYQDIKMASPFPPMILFPDDAIHEIHFIDICGNPW